MICPCAGVIVFHHRKSQCSETILVTSKKGNYSFPKGKREQDESLWTAALRELEEETGIKDTQLKFYSNIFFEEKSEKGFPSVRYYLAEIIKFTKDFTYDQKELRGVNWVPVDDVYKLDNIKETRKDILKQSVEYIKDPSKVKTVNSKQMDNYYSKHLSKKLSWILRHGIFELGLKMRPDGYVLLEDVLKTKIMKEYNSADIKYVVRTNAKQRFNIVKENKQLYVRANQGHSKNVGALLDDNLMMTELKKPITCFHQTNRKVMNNIMKNGLNKMERKHIHFTTNNKLNRGNVKIYINMEAAMKDGIKFYRSANDVILSYGKEGVIDPKYFDKIV